MNIRFIFLILLLSSFAYGGVVFEDDFSDGDANGWTEWTSGYGATSQYNVVDEEYILSNSGSGWIPAASHNGDQGGIMSTPDYSIIAQVTPESCYRAGIFARGYIPSFTGYLLVMIPSENKFGIAKLTSSGPTMVTSITMPISFNETYWVRFDLQGTSLSGKIWQGVVTDEPVDWQLTCTNALYSGAGRMGAFCCNFSSDERATLSVRYDNISVSVAESNLSQVTWAAIKSSI